MNYLLIFARAPVPGQVKTRLAAHIGPRAAAQLYAALLKDTLSVAQSAPCETILCYTPDDAFEPGDDSLSNFWQGHKLAQSGADLGEKMRNALQNRFAEEATKVLTKGLTKVLLIGSDLPELSLDLLTRAFDALETHDFVFGPTRDGGFYLIGARAPVPATLFENVLWSHDSTLQSVLCNARKENRRVALLPMGADVDEWSDVQTLLARPDLTQIAPHFSAALKQIL